jgi:hypothetical protein
VHSCPVLQATRPSNVEGIITWNGLNADAGVKEIFAARDALVSRCPESNRLQLHNILPQSKFAADKNSPWKQSQHPFRVEQLEEGSVSPVLSHTIILYMDLRANAEL